VFSGCHGVASGMPLVYLGDKMATPSSFAQQVYDGIVNKASVEDPSMPYVTKSDPAMSFLMRKMDGDFASLTCVADNSLFQKYAMQYSLTSPCGGQMPEQLMPLDGDDGGSPGPRDQVRRWIAQGAKNN